MNQPPLRVSEVPISLYVHIPFCETKCPYCDFNTYARIESLIPSYVPALQSEVRLWGDLLGHPAVATVFFGGGTPSYLPAENVGAVLETVRQSFGVDASAEITLEANPGDLTPAKLAQYLDLGINRLSIGVQSLDDRLLKILGRRHCAREAVDAYRMALRGGFDNVSIDLMYGLPRQGLRDWEETLDGAAALEPRHMSMYCLTLEAGTPMEQWVRVGTMPDPDPDLAADMYLAAQDLMRARAYRHYEISNWAQPGYQARHNLTYWRNQPYLGVGPGAHSYLLGHRFANLKSPGEYVRRLEADVPLNPDGGSLTKETLKQVPVVDMVESIDRRLEISETLMLGLRLDSGVSIAEFEGRFGETPAQVYGETLVDLSADGLLETSNGSVMLTPRGRLMANDVFSRFFG